ncbi:MAG: FadR family transcriptional regulator [Actinobacteria bacterium]|nr:FadR family transcriptional regulator [Actinomycetota bacterium]
MTVERTHTNDEAGNGSARVFHPIRGSRPVFEVVDQLTFAIQSGAYGEGARLPTMPRLAEALGVSIPTIGEAVRLLTEAGVLEVRRGATGGISVASPYVPARLLKLSTQVRARSLRPIVEARRPVEIELAALAAQRATEADFDAMEAANRDLVAFRGQQPQWGIAHNAFHYAMGRAARSELLAHMQHEILEEIAILLDNYGDRFSDPERTLREHRETLAVLRRRDPAAAREVMSVHLGEFEELAEAFDRQLAEAEAEAAVKSPAVRRRDPATQR